MPPRAKREEKDSSSEEDIIVLLSPTRSKSSLTKGIKPTSKVSSPQVVKKATTKKVVQVSPEVVKKATTKK